MSKQDTFDRGSARPPAGRVKLDLKLPLFAIVGMSFLLAIILIGSRPPEFVGADKRLWQAVRAGDVAMMNEAIRQNANVNSRDSDEQTPLMELAENMPPRALNLAKMLIDAGADVNCRDREQRSIPMLMMERAAPESGKLLDLLFDRGVSITPVDSEGRTALHYAAKPSGKGRYTSRLVERAQLAEQLIRHGANVNANTAALHMTPLHDAVSEFNYPVIQVLVRNGASKVAKTDQGYTAVDFANFSGRSDEAKDKLNAALNSDILATTKKAE